MAGIEPQGPAEVGDEEGMAPNVSPEEQQQYEEFVLSALALIYDKAPDSPDQAQGAAPKGKQAVVRPGILKLLDDDPSDLRGILGNDELKQFSPLVAIAATGVIITVEIQKLAGDEKPADDIVMHGSAAIIEELAEIWMRRNKQEMSQDDIHKALSMAAAIYGQVGADAGLVDENALKDQFADLVKADKSGNLESVSPELAGVNKAAETNMTEGDDVPSPDQAEEQAEPVDNAQEEDEEK